MSLSLNRKIFDKKSPYTYKTSNYFHIIKIKNFIINTIYVYIPFFSDMSRGDPWSGRICCPLPHSESCRRACITATSSFDLTKGCRQSDEIAFFSCLERQEGKILKQLLINLSLKIRYTYRMFITSNVNEFCTFNIYQKVIIKASLIVHNII